MRMSSDWWIKTNNMLHDLLIPRRCNGCRKRQIFGRHDPCIGTLPQTRVACCGHGYPRDANGHHSGYVGLNDGRTILFSGLDGNQIRAMVDTVLARGPLPHGAEFDAKLSWWAGLTDAQYLYAMELLRAAQKEARTFSKWFDACQRMEEYAEQARAMA